MVKKTIEKIKALIGMHSLVGVNTSKFPVGFGNYFDFRSGERCLNMWAENLREFASKKEILEIECTVFSDGKSRLAFVTDKRVPTEWLHSRLCVTGRGWNSRELCEACCEFQGASTVNRICGCEAPDQAPRLGQSFRKDSEYYPYKGTNHCHNCGRKFPIVKEEK